MQKKIVHRIEDGQNPQDVLCTTYQMRNFYNQLHDGYFSNLDIMNYAQHLAAARLCRSGMKVLDVCCGRSLMLPLLRYHAKEIYSYTGVDISKANIAEAMRGASKKLTPEELRTYYPFNVRWVNANVAEMSSHIPEQSQNFIIYTSALEHMHKDVGFQSLLECYKVMADDGAMFLSCPNTPGNGYNTQYRAHVYEWGYDELKAALNEIGFVITQEIGLVMGAAEMSQFYQQQPEEIRQFYQTLKSYLPKEFLTTLMAIPYPQQSKEILFIVKKGQVNE